MLSLYIWLRDNDVSVDDDDIADVADVDDDVVVVVMCNKHL